jgi:cobalt-zinc-cadmium efflux system outer membrane protein
MDMTAARVFFSAPHATTVARFSREFRRRAVSCLLALACLFGAERGRTEQAPLTRKRIATLVDAAPAMLVARSEASVASARVTAAAVLSLENPVLSGMGGVRFNADGSRPFNGVATLSWPVDVGGKRGARVEAAEAEQRASEASTNQQARELLLAALLQHAAVLRDQRAVLVARARRTLSERVLAAAQRRHSAGSVPELDVALAGMQEKRDQSAEAAATGSQLADQLTLATLLGLPRSPGAEGSLVPEGEVPPLSGAVKRVAERPDVRFSTAALRAAQAKAERERASRAPTLNLLAQYERDDHDNIGLLGLALPIPVLNANRSEVATSAAEVDAAKARAEQARSVATGQLKELYARYAATKAAMDSLAPTAALATRAVNLATRGYELGENDLASVLLVRREAVDAEGALLEAEHAHASAKLALLVAVGKLPE